MNLVAVTLFTVASLVFPVGNATDAPAESTPVVSVSGAAGSLS